MKRLPEPELMEDHAQVKAYAKADFEIPHYQFIERLKLFINKPQFSGTALDLGCGPGDISCRFAKAFPLSKVHAVDGSEAMIDYCKLSTSRELKTRIRFILGMLPDVILPQSGYEIIFCNSLLHHLHDPQGLWQVIKKYSRQGTRVVVMDLLRPDCLESAQKLVKTYALDEPEILKRDFYYSLLAAYTLPEIKKQLTQAGLNFFVEQISDRHVFITGIAP
ncbi:Methyltransferase type 11 [Candidatus Methylobacter favarea]|uniref:Methyltransferase type 11 n=1 Tax=Candidatus Methylobacter favarea TaxID=2707345 RepID=A0A8S0WSG9_9GAMM|nr:class I SAM-dependent methyltransferase [Candidatus Methylobacter favarea]CAA9892751.1 Methyltransferase type 11 [Candidatus Methylobacter favarea]